MTSADRASAPAATTTAGAAVPPAAGTRHTGRRPAAPGRATPTGRFTATRRASAVPARRGGARGLALVVALLSAAVAVLAGAAPAQAAGYRYWSYWQATGTTWTYATEGPALARPADGAVHGFRFAVSADSSDASRPRTAPDFEAVCGTTPAVSGTKRVALVIDPGTSADAPSGERPPAPRTACAHVHRDATAAEALARVAKPLRYDGNALLCAISGYPATGCGEQVAAGAGAEDTAAPGTAPADSGEATTAATGDNSDGGPSLGIFAAVALFAVLGAATLRQSRRRSR